MDIHVSIKTHSPRLNVSPHLLDNLRNAGLGPPRLFRWSNVYGEYETLCCGVFYSYVKSYVREYRGDMKAINRHLWMASKRSQSTWVGLVSHPFLEMSARLLSAPHHYREYRQLQQSFPTFSFRYTVYYQAYRKGWPLINLNN